MNNVYQKDLTKETVFNSIQAIAHIKDYLEKPLRVVGVHYKPVVTKNGEEKTLTVLFVKNDDDTLYSIFSSAKSFYNGVSTLVEVFGESIKERYVDVKIGQVEIARDQSIYTVNLI